MLSAPFVRCPSTWKAERSRREDQVFAHYVSRRTWFNLKARCGWECNNVCTALLHFPWMWYRHQSRRWLSIGATKVRGQERRKRENVWGERMSQNFSISLDKRHLLEMVGLIQCLLLGSCRTTSSFKKLLSAVLLVGGLRQINIIISVNHTYPAYCQQIHIIIIMFPTHYHKKCGSSVYKVRKSWKKSQHLHHYNKIVAVVALLIFDTLQDGLN